MYECVIAAGLLYLWVKLPKLLHAAGAGGKRRVAAALRDTESSTAVKPGGFKPVGVVINTTALQLTGIKTQRAQSTTYQYNTNDIYVSYRKQFMVILLVSLASFEAVLLLLVVFINVTLHTACIETAAPSTGMKEQLKKHPQKLAMCAKC